MARGVARSTRGGQGGRTINARTGNDANRISRKRSRARGSQRQAEDFTGKIEQIKERIDC
jgi:hypothetical protein